jgi:hypothetical protein
VSATAVTLTLWTCGPNLPTDCQSGTGGDGRRSTGANWTVAGGRSYASARPSAFAFFTLIWVVVVGMVRIGRNNRGRSGLYGCFAAICLGLGLMALISCGAVASGGGSGTVTVTVNPGLATLFANEAGNSWPAGATQQQFAATVNGSTESVTWAVTGGNANGTIGAAGLYAAPAAVPNPATVTVTATPATGTAGSTFVTVAAPTAVGTSQITVTATAAGGAAHGDVVTLIVR